MKWRGKGNHKRPGTFHSKMEFTAPKLIAMGREVRKEIELFWQQLGKGDSERYRSAEDEQKLDQHLKRLWKGWNPRHIRQIATVEEQKRLADVCKKLHLGKMSNAREINPKGSRLAKYRLSSKSLGVRKLLDQDFAKQTRLNAFLKFWKMVKIYHSFERMMGHDVDASDLYQEFVDVVGRELQTLEKAESLMKLSKKQIAWKAQMADRLKRLQDSEGYRKNYVTRMMTWMGAKIGAPSKRSDLSAEQEQIRWQMTVQGHDYQIWRAAFADEDELKHYVADAKRFINRRKETVLLYSDESPFWVKIGFRKVAFADWEQGKRVQGAQARSGQMSQAPADSAVQQVDAERALEGAAAEKIKGNVKQKKGPGKSGDERFRITFVCIQGVLDWFNMEKDPTGVIYPSVLIVYGTHCRWENIDENRCWKEMSSLRCVGR